MVRAIGLVFFVFVGCVALVFGQSTNASLSGRVTDPAKAVVAAARIVAVSAGTHVRYETITNASGEYSLVTLPRLFPPPPTELKSRSRVSRSWSSRMWCFKLRMRWRSIWISVPQQPSEDHRCKRIRRARVRDEAARRASRRWADNPVEYGRR